MAQDFAKQRSNPDDTRRRRSATRTAAPPAGNANWSWFFSGLMTGVIVSIAAYLGVMKLEEGVIEEAQATQSGAEPENQPTYSFYEVLSQAEVPVNVPATAGSQSASANADPAPASIEPAVAPVQTAAVDARSELWLLQAGSFQNRQDAENQRARIILLNLNANITEGIVAGRTHYRVQVGPFADRQNADTARNLLTGNDIESIFMRITP